MNVGSTIKMKEPSVLFHNALVALSQNQCNDFYRLLSKKCNISTSKE